MAEDCDYLIVGSGVIGLAIGISLLEANQSLKLKIYEKEKNLGEHASGRNSGVLHAGFYYSPDSLKAKFCAEGNRELKTLCKANGLPILEIGKVVVTSSIDELSRLESLYLRGLENKIDLELFPESKLQEIEPAARTYGKFLWSPTTAIADPKSIIGFLAQRFQKLGGQIVVGGKVELKESNSTIKAFSDNKEIPAHNIVNASGVHADSLAKSIGVGTEFACLPFKGVYRVAKKNDFSPRTLIYPVPHPINPFLGVHVTLTLDGDIKIGPTAMPLLGKERYSVTSKLEFREILESAKSMLSLITGKEYHLGEIIKTEAPKYLTNYIVQDIARIVPSMKDIRKWEKIDPGIRAQLVNLETGTLEQDFIVRKFLNSTHILNAVSPGWTCALPFGRWITQTILKDA